MDIKEFRKSRLAKIAKKAESQMMYNPLTQKPAHMEPVGPRGGFCYYGPMPDQGTSYGMYEDEKGNKAVCMAGERVYSPYTGTEMKKVEDFDAAKVKDMIPAESCVGSYSCTACRTPLFLSDKKAASAMDKMYCTQCGSEMADVLSQLKASAQYDPEAPKPIHEVAPEPELQPVAPAPVEEPAKESTPEEKAKESKPESKVEEKPAEEAKKEEPMPESKESSIKESVKESTPESKAPESVKESSTPAAAQKESSTKESSLPSESLPDSSEEEVVVAPVAPEIGMPLAAQKESSKESSKESTKESPAPAVEAVKESSTKEMPLADPTKKEESTVPAEAQKESSTKEGAESTPASQESTPEAKVEAPVLPAAEPVVPESKGPCFESLFEVPAEVKADEVHMTLYNVEKENPYWNIEVKGNPVARVSLADQDNPTEDRIVFVSKEYAEILARAMEKVGAKPILDTMKAKYFANKVDETVLAAKIRSEIKAELEKEHTEKLASLRNDFIDCLNIATSAVNKNWYTEEGHALKEALYARMDKAGVYDPIEIIEGAFEESSGEFFNNLFTKAVEIMNKHPEARAELRETLSKTNSIPVQASAELPRKRVSLAEKLEQASFNLQSTGPVEKEDLKALIKNKVHLGYRK